mmetsp:Transcript_7052/g.19683  ORF Transcript_7052/g.19683 Transcript_7052/m.19683 type:complete len:343 (-) Transcript_7052:1171-2199(-)
MPITTRPIPASTPTPATRTTAFRIGWTIRRTGERQRRQWKSMPTLATTERWRQRQRQRHRWAGGNSGGRRVGPGQDSESQQPRRRRGPQQHVRSAVCHDRAGLPRPSRTDGADPCAAEEAQDRGHLGQPVAEQASGDGHHEDPWHRGRLCQSQGRGGVRESFAHPDASDQAVRHAAGGCPPEGLYVQFAVLQRPDAAGGGLDGAGHRRSARREADRDPARSAHDLPRRPSPRVAGDPIFGAIRHGPQRGHSVGRAKSRGPSQPPPQGQPGAGGEGVGGDAHRQGRSAGTGPRPHHAAQAGGIGLYLPARCRRDGVRDVGRKGLWWKSGGLGALPRTWMGGGG